jgi:glucosamine-6-phosphate deaminase
MNVQVFKGKKEIGTQIAGLIVEKMKGRKSFVLGLAAGNTPIPIYQGLVERFNKGVSFANVHTFMLDEFVGLASGHSKSFKTFAKVQLLNSLNVPVNQQHFPDDDGDYEEKITRLGGIDLQILGIGINGHIAFNEPGSWKDSRTRQVELSPSTLDIIKKDFGTEPVPNRAITMGIGTILESKEIILMATGKNKGLIVKQALEGPVTSDIPASFLQDHNNVSVFLDFSDGTHLKP